MAKVSIMGNGIAAQEIVGEIVTLVTKAHEPGWDRLEIWNAQASSFGKSSIKIITAGDITWGRASDEVLDLFEDLKDAMYRPDTGTWLSVKVTVHPDGSADVDYNYDRQPEWGMEVEPGLYAGELESYPRSMENIPDWMKADAGL